MLNMLPHNSIRKAKQEVNPSIQTCRGENLPALTPYTDKMIELTKAIFNQRFRRSAESCEILQAALSKQHKGPQGIKGTIQGNVGPALAKQIKNGLPVLDKDIAFDPEKMPPAKKPIMSAMIAIAMCRI